MQIILGIIFFLLGFVGETVLIFTEEDKEACDKITIAGFCGALTVAGFVLLL